MLIRAARGNCGESSIKILEKELILRKAALPAT